MKRKWNFLSICSVALAAMPLMMKCNMCYDRTSVGKKPMCATVCPSQALYYGTREEMKEKRPNSVPVNHFIFGKERVKTKVNLMMPKGSSVLKVN